MSPEGIGLDSPGLEVDYKAKRVIDEFGVGLCGQLFVYELPG